MVPRTCRISITGPPTNKTRFSTSAVSFNGTKYTHPHPMDIFVAPYFHSALPPSSDPQPQYSKVSRDILLRHKTHPSRPRSCIILISCRLQETGLPRNCPLLVVHRVHRQVLCKTCQKRPKQHRSTWREVRSALVFRTRDHILLCILAH